MFGTGAWPSLNRGETLLFQRTVMSLYRQTLCVPKGEDQHISGAMTCSLLGLADPPLCFVWKGCDTFVSFRKQHLTPFGPLSGMILRISTSCVRP